MYHPTDSIVHNTHLVVPSSMNDLFEYNDQGIKLQLVQAVQK